MIRLWSVFSYLQTKSFRLFEKVLCSLVVIDDCECLCELSPVSIFGPFHVSAMLMDLSRFSIFIYPLLAPSLVLFELFFFLLTT